MQLPDSLIVDLKKRVKELFEETYLKCLSSTEEEFDIFIESIFNEVLDEVDNLIEVTNDTVYTYVKRRMMTKKRWANKEISKQENMYNEVEISAKVLYEHTLSGKPEKHQIFHSLYGYDTYEELKEGRPIELKKWAEDHEEPICKFIYITFKTKKQILTAICNDIKYIVFNEIYSKCPKGKQSAIPSLPLSMSQLPIDYTSKVKVENKLVENDQAEYFLNKYIIDDNTVLESRLNAEILKTGVLDTVLKTLNSTDISVFLYCMSLRDENFYTTREIIVDIGDIVKNVFGSKGQKNYIAVKESLYRMQYLNSGLIDNSLRGFTVKIFDNVDIYSTKETKRETAKIVVNIDIVNEYIKEQTVSMYKDVIDRFKLESSKVAIFPIQRERIKVATNTEEDDELFMQTNFNFFRGILYFSNKRKKENIKTIEKMLEEIIENEIAIKGFERKGDTFILEFFPISPQERKDLLNQKKVNQIMEASAEQIKLPL